MMIIADNCFKNQEYTFTAKEEDAGKRLDKFLFDKIQSCSEDKVSVSRMRIKDLVETENATKNGEKFTNCSYKIKVGDIINIKFPEIKSSEILPKNIPLDIVFEDEYMLVINKQAGLTTHPGAGNYDNTLVNALLYHCKGRLSSIRGVERPGIVHRLDKDTSGLMVVAKTDKAHHSLSKQIEERTFERRYYAFIQGVMSPRSGVIEGNIKKSAKNRIKMEVLKEGGKTAKTNYKTLEVYANSRFSLVECKLDTGRTHQIRVHFSNLKHPLIGDTLYIGGRKTLSKSIQKEICDFIQNFPRQALHSYNISFTHPITKKALNFSVKLPNDLLKLEKNLKNIHSI
jgi:23S rRNA pseudouridine1911/1915/1917 synthase